MEWTAGALERNSSSATSSSAPVVSFAAFDKLIVFLSATSWGCCSKHEPAAQLQSSIHASCTVLHFFPPSHSLRTILLTTQNILRLSVLRLQRVSPPPQLVAKKAKVCLCRQEGKGAQIMSGPKMVNIKLLRPLILIWQKGGKINKVVKLSALTKGSSKLERLDDDLCRKLRNSIEQRQQQRSLSRTIR